MNADGLIVVQSPEIAYIPDTTLNCERLSGSHATACASDTSSGPVPTLTADAVNHLTIVPVTNLNSVSLMS
jgi:hypothetical protein